MKLAFLLVIPSPETMHRCRLPLHVPMFAFALVMNLPKANADMFAFGPVMNLPEANAALLPLDGNWITLISPEVLVRPTSASPYTFLESWTLSSSTPFKLTVTDWLWAGDLFEVWNNGILLGTGSSIVTSGAYASTPDLALSNAYFSHNSWILQPGDYSFTFKSTQFAPNFKNGTIAFKAEQLVPDSGTTLVLLGVALTGIASLRRHRCVGIRAGLDS